MPRYTPSPPGRLLVTHLAAYGFALVLDNEGEEAFVGHVSDSLEADPFVDTPAAPERAVDCIRASAERCDELVLADCGKGQPTLWARATGKDRARAALRERERLLDEQAEAAGSVGDQLAAGLGAPAAWLAEHPEYGATRLDGVTGNATSDFVRGVLRGTAERQGAREAAAELEGEAFKQAWDGTRWPGASSEYDRTGWAPPRTRVTATSQWLAALGLGLLPVGLVSSGRSRTPCTWTDDHVLGVTLPVLRAAVSVPRLRALLQQPALANAGPVKPRDAARLCALGIGELMAFRAVNRATGKSVAFTFGLGTLVAL